MNLIDEEELYKTNPRVKDYVDKYMRTHGLIDLESALQCIMVKNFIEYAVCDEYCKFPDLIPEDVLWSTCEQCPLGRLG